MSVSWVWVQIHPETRRPIRIFRHWPRYTDHRELWDRELIQRWAKAPAVAEVRLQVFERDQSHCVYCGAIATDLHERVFRSHEGEISLENSVAACRRCHKEEHGLL